VAAVAAASGQAAQFMAVSTIAGAGDNIVSTSYLYGGVRDRALLIFLLHRFVSLLDIQPIQRWANLAVIIRDARAHRGRSALQEIWNRVKFVTSDDPAAFSAAIDEKTKAIFVESIGNPKYNVSPISEIAKVCKNIFVISHCD
jgi:O-acetylhomoserine/O-acetylserine sulfhydrylase